MRDGELQRLEQKRERGVAAGQVAPLVGELLELVEAEAFGRLQGGAPPTPEEAHLWACRLWAVGRLKVMLRAVILDGVNAEQAIQMVDDKGGDVVTTAASIAAYRERAARAREAHAQKMNGGAKTQG